MRTFAWTFALVTSVALAPGRAHADASSREMVEKGIQLRREHRDAEALEEFRRADKLNPAPRIRAQIGLAEQALAQWVEAENDLKQALSAHDDPWIRDHAEALKNALVIIQQHLGSLMVETNVDGAELWINGSRFGTLPMTTARVVSGAVNVEVRSAGYETVRRPFDVPPGKTVSERLVLVAAPPSAEATSSPSGPPGAVPDTPSPPSTQRLLAWGSLGAAGAALGGAIAAQIVSQVSAGHYNDNGQCLKPNGGTRDEQCGQYRWRAETAQSFAYIGYAGVGVFGIAAVTLFLTSPAPRRPTTSALWVDARPDGWSVGWREAF